MRKHSFEICDLMNVSYFKHLETVLETARKFKSPVCNKIIIIDYGHTLVQNECNDETGWFVKFRCDPLTVRTDWSKRTLLVGEFIRALQDTFGLSAKHVVDEGQSEKMCEASVEVYFSTGIQSIGD